MFSPLYSQTVTPIFCSHTHTNLRIPDKVFRATSGVSRLSGFVRWPARVLSSCWMMRRAPLLVGASFELQSSIHLAELLGITWQNLRLSSIPSVLTVGSCSCLVPSHDADCSGVMLDVYRSFIAPLEDAPAPVVATGVCQLWIFRCGSTHLTAA